MTAQVDSFASRLFGREYELERLQQYVLKGKSCQVVGPRGIGKTALLRALQELAPTWDNALFVAYLDLNNSQTQTAEGFWQAAWQEWREGNTPVSPADRSERIAEWYKRGRRPVLCLDGFEQLISRQEEFTGRFFEKLRSMAEAGLCIVTASSVPLSELVPPYSRASPFFNVFAILRLGALPREDAEDFLTTISAEKLPLTPQERNAILDFAEAHRSAYPLALQTATTQVIQAKRTGNDLSSAMYKASEALKEVI